MKTCKKCNKEFELNEFYKCKGMKDGHLNSCKSCVSSGVRKNRKKNIEHYRSYDRKRGNRQAKGYQDNYRKEFQKIYKAQNMVNNAIRDKKIKRIESCSLCGSNIGIHAHHDDYNYPLDIRWLCAVCHAEWHDINGEGKNSK